MTVAVAAETSPTDPADGKTSDGKTSGAADVHTADVHTTCSLAWPLRYLATCLLLAAFCFNTDAGKIVPDTKLDLVIDPGRFLGRALHMWDGQGFAGQMQNQAYGYLFPIGPFFALGRRAHLEPWAIQRLWWSTLLCVAFLGLSKLAGRLRIGTPTSRFLAGLAYALSPHVLSRAGAACRPRRCPCACCPGC